MTTVIRGDSISLRNGATYRARLRLTGLACDVDLGDIVNALSDLGFIDIRIFKRPSSLPDDWPDDQLTIEADPGASQCPRWFQGTWSLGDSTHPKAMFEPSVPFGSITLLSVWVHSEKELGRAGRPRNVVEADPIVRLAWGLEFPGTALPPETRQALLSIGLFEGGWGNSNYVLPDGTKVDNANNWGSIHCPLEAGSSNQQRTTPRAGELWTHCVRGGDRLTKDGKRFEVLFRAYAKPVDGARALIRFLRGIRPELATGNADVIARAMKPVFNYGVSIDDYAHAIAHNAKFNAAKLKEPNRIFREADGVQTSVLLLALGGATVAITAVGVTIWYTERRRAA